MAYKEGQPKAVLREAYAPPAYLLDHTDLTFELSEGVTEVTAQLSLKRAPGQAPAPLELLGQDLELLSVALDGVALTDNEYRLEGDTLVIPAMPQSGVVTVRTRIYPEKNTALEGLYRSGGMYCTQCEAEGFRRITYSLDRPDVLSRYRTTIRGDGAQLPIMLSNGNELSRRTLEDGRQEVVWEDPFPKPSYLFALVAGDLQWIEDHFVTASGRTVLLRIYTEPHNIGQVDYAMDALKRSMRWDEETYGREYDLDIFMIVAVDDFNMGAMENKGLNIFNTSCVLATPEFTTDLGFQRVEAVVAHEYFHNWSGNRVTCRDWFQLSLKEGFTVLRDAQFSADQNSPTVKRIEDARFLRTAQFAEDASPMAHPVRPDSYLEISNFYTLTVYEKGAEVVRMMRTLLGGEHFRAGTDLYFERHDGQAVTCEDFVLAMEAASGEDLSQFRLWYSQAGTPELVIDAHFAEGTLTLEIEQRLPATPGQLSKAPMHIPLMLGLLGADGQDLLPGALAIDGAEATPRPEARSVLLHLREARHRVTISGLKTAPVLSLLRDFSAPVKLTAPQSDADLAFLMVHDSDGFARWDAADQLMTRVLLARLENPEAPVPPVLNEAFGALVAAAQTAPDDGEAKAMLAAMMTLPGEDALAQLVPVVDVHAIHGARSALRKALGAAHQAALLALYDADGPRPYAPDAEGIAHRSLMNLALSYLLAAGVPGAVSRAQARYDQADNMTDRLAALRALLWSGREEAVAAAAPVLEAFLGRYRDQPLVVDQWLSTQALVPGEATLDQVQALTTHEAFDARNPNKLRALLGAFAGQNPTAFHRPDGAGYRFLGQWIETLDQQNPQVAARLLTPLTRWRRYPSAAQAQMKAELERLAERIRSPDVYEVVSKSLA
ncbi:MAG: aminopeptidase N [Pseudomonadales bacterium]|nr:aminopeptidase N [Pseudomonadales bacterium]